MDINTCRKAHLLASVLALYFIQVEAGSQYMTDYTGPVFPGDHALNMRIDSLPVHSKSDSYINNIGKTTALHPDFGTSWDDGGTLLPMGIPYNVVGAGQPKVPITYTAYPDESDPGPWPIPKNPFIETVSDWKDTTEGDRHMLIVDSSAHILYETGGTTGNSDGTAWKGGCGAVFDLAGYKLRTETWTSADAAGLPIFPLLIRYDEVSRAMATGKEIPHAIRFTVDKTQKAYIWPARHYASSSTDANRPPMGLRFRLKANFDISGFPARMQVILRTMKKYGMIVSDNGSNWYFQGSHDDRWDDEEINTLKSVHGGDFEAVDISPWTNRAGFNINSGKVPGVSGTRAPSVSHLCNSQNLLIHQTPHASSLSIEYTVEMDGFASILVYDVSGAEVKTVLKRAETKGMHTIRWDGKNSAGRHVCTGAYFIKLTGIQGFAVIKRIMIVGG
jgi:hypothetical protein